MARFERSLTGLAIFLSTLTLLFTACAVGGITAEVRWAHFERKINNCDIRVAFGLLRYYVKLPPITENNERRTKTPVTIITLKERSSMDAIRIPLQQRTTNQTAVRSQTMRATNARKLGTPRRGINNDESLIERVQIAQPSIHLSDHRVRDSLLRCLHPVFAPSPGGHHNSQLITALPPPAPLAGFWPAIVNKLVTGVALEIVSLFLLITFAVFKGSCYDEMKDASQFDGYSKDLSAGFALTVLAWLFSMAAGLVEILKNPDPEVPSQNAQGKLSNAANVGDMKAPGRAVDADNGGGVPTVPGQDLEEFLHDNQSHMEVPTVPIDDGGNNGATDGGAQRFCSVTVDVGIMW
eukprot:jgi/Bigna1/69974/fgenesh1_pg.10_\